MNPLLNKQEQSMNLKELYQVCQNPEKARNLLNQFLGNNPMFRTLANKGDFRALYEELCKSKGINPQDFMSSLEAKFRG